METCLLPLGAQKLAQVYQAWARSMKSLRKKKKIALTKRQPRKVMSNKREEILEASDHGSNHAFAGRGSVARLIAPIRAQSSAGSAQRGISPALAHTSEGSTYSRKHWRPARLSQLTPAPREREGVKVGPPSTVESSTTPSRVGAQPLCLQAIVEEVLAAI